MSDEQVHPAVAACAAETTDEGKTAAVLRWAADRTRDSRLGDPVGGCMCGIRLDRDANEIDPPKWEPDAPTVTTTLQAAIAASGSLADVHNRLYGVAPRIPTEGSP